MTTKIAALVRIALTFSLPAIGQNQTNRLVSAVVATTPGRFKTFASSPSLEQESFAAHAVGGYTWSKAWGGPRVGLEYDFASHERSQ